MQQDIKLYEKKVLQDREFPIQIQNNCIKTASERSMLFSPHWHEHIELHYVVSGQEEIVLDQKKIMVKAGEMLVVNGNVLHAGYMTKGYPVEELVFIFEMAALSKTLADKNIIFQQLICDDSAIFEMMERIYPEVKNKNEGYLVACKGILLQLLVHLYRNYAQELLTEKESMKRLKKLERFNTVKRYIQKHYPDPISNHELAELVHLSEDRFNHLFKECIGESPLQYINEIRLNKAMTLLKTGEYSATEVAERVGFSDYNYFGRLFRRTYGCTPSQVQKGKENA